MKILGVMLTYNNLEFLKCSLKQALDFCDELILIEGGHLQNRPKHSTDGTIEYIQTLSDPKLVIIDDWNYTGRNHEIQCYLREHYAKQSPLWEPGNWICQWDDDIAFFKEDLPKIKKVMEKTKRDMIRFKERMFIYNFRFNLYKNSVGTYHFDKITEDCYYTPMWKMHYKDGTFYRDKKYEYMKKIDYLHYTFVRSPERLKIRFECSYEKGYKDAFKRFDKFMSVKWKDDNDIYNSRHVIEDLTNEWGFNIYNGPHPEIMDNHPWRYVQDTRQLESKIKDIYLDHKYILPSTIKMQKKYITKKRFPFYDLARMYLPIDKKAVVLDINTGDALFAKYLHLKEKYENLFLLDGNKNTVSKLKNKFNKVLLYNAPNKLPFDDSSVDYIHCDHSIKHLCYEDLYAFLKEIDRVLKNRGIFVISAPLFTDDFYRDLSHVKPYYPRMIFNYLCDKSIICSSEVISQDYTILDLVYGYGTRDIKELQWKSSIKIIDLIINILKKMLSTLKINKDIRTGITLVLEKSI